MSVPLVVPVDGGARVISRRTTVAAPAHELFAIVADPRRHHELDGSGTVGAEVTGPQHLQLGDKFTVGMKQLGVPYKITSTVTALEEDRVVEWQHPASHRWRWEFLPLTDDTTQVTETFDYRESKAGRLYELFRFTDRDAKGIEATLEKLRASYM